MVPAMEKFIVFDVVDGGDKVFVGEFDSEELARASLNENKLQSLERETIYGKQVIFSRDRLAE